MSTRPNMLYGADTRGVRIELRQLVYLDWPGDSAFILNLSDCGMAIQAMEVIEPGQSFAIGFPLPGTQAEVQGEAKVVWSDRSGRAGLEFTGLSELDRFQLMRWVKKQCES